MRDNNRRARYYRLTVAGRRRLGEAVDSWNRLVAAMSAAINARTKEA